MDQKIPAKARTSAPPTTSSIMLGDDGPVGRVAGWMTPRWGGPGRSNRSSVPSGATGLLQLCGRPGGVLLRPLDLRADPLALGAGRVRIRRALQPVDRVVRVVDDALEVGRRLRGRSSRSGARDLRRERDVLVRDLVRQLLRLLG